MNIEDLKDPSKIPNPIKLALIVATTIVTCIGGYFLDTSDQITTLEEMQAQEVKNKESWQEKKRQAVNLAAHKKQLDEIEIAFGTLLKQLPNKSEMDALLNDVNQSGTGRGLNFEIFRPNPSEILTEFYAEQQVAITVSGGFHDIGTFLEDLSKLNRIVNVTDVNIRNGVDQEATMKGVQPKITMEASVRTYRYLDEKDKKGAPKK